MVIDVRLKVRREGSGWRVMGVVDRRDVERMRGEVLWRFSLHSGSERCAPFEN